MTPYDNRLEKHEQAPEEEARAAQKRLVRDTVLHEVAHALVGPGKGHGDEWKAKCVEVGAAPKRLKNGAKGEQPPINRQTPKWVARCCDCGHVIRRSRVSEWAKRGCIGTQPA